MKRISQRDIARKLGINVSTVSRALRGLDGVSPELREKIEKLAKVEGYSPNPFALSLRYDRTRTIGVVVPDVAFSHYAHIVKQIEAEARENGYMCIITDSNDRYNNERRCLELLLNMHVEGVIACLSQETRDFAHLRKLKEAKVPVVLFDRVADATFSSVIINDADSAREATKWLIDGGARRIAFLGGDNQMKQTADRKHGYLQALKERHIPVRKQLVMCNPISYNSGLSDTLQLLNMTQPPDAILAAHGLLATSALQAINSRGLRIPQDIAIVGYVSDWVSEMATPRMSFVKQNLKEIAAAAFRLLLHQINGDNTIQRRVVNARLEIRDTTRNLKIEN